VRVSRTEGGDTNYAVAVQGSSALSPVPLNQAAAQVAAMIRANPSCFAAVNNMVIEGMPDKEIRLGSTPYFLEKYRLELIIGKAVK